MNTPPVPPAPAPREPRPARFDQLTGDYLGLHPDDAECVVTATTAVAATTPGEALRALATSGHLDLPLPGAGETWTRFRRLAEIAAVDLSLGRLAEGHADAIAILAEAKLDHDPTALYGVWAAGGQVLVRPGTGAFVLHGEREYCSGAGVLDRALIAAKNLGGEPILAVANLWNAGVHIQPETWLAVGMADSLSANVQFHTVPAHLVGGPGFYTNRPGFWQGSVGVAAVWYGGALGLARAVCGKLETSDPVARAQATELHLAIAGMRLVLQQASAEIDGASCESPNVPFARAMLVRHAVYEDCRTVLDLASRIGGTGLATHDRAQARRFADLPIYLQQHHPARDLAAVGEILAASRESRR